MKRRKRSHREGTLSPSVVEALADLKAVAKPETQWWREAREAFLAQAQTELGGDQVFSGEAEPVVSDTEHVKSEAGLKALLLPLWERRPKSMLARLVVALGIVLGGTWGTVEAARSSLPGSALYPVKLRVEELKTESVQDPEDRIERLLEAAEERLEEARRLAEQQEIIPIELVNRYAEQLALASEAIESLSEPVRSEVQVEVAEELQEHLDEIHELQLMVGDGDENLAAMVSAIEDLASQVGGLGGDLDDDKDDEVWDDEADDDVEDDSEEIQDTDDIDPDDEDGDESADEAEDEDSTDLEDDGASDDDTENVDDGDGGVDDEHNGSAEEHGDPELDDESGDGDDQVDEDDDSSGGPQDDDDEEDDSGEGSSDTDDDEDDEDDEDEEHD